MQFNEFCARVCDDMKVFLASQEINTDKIDIHKVVKNNGVNLTALLIQQEDVNIAPTIYLEPFYEKYEGGMLYEDVLNDIGRTYVENIQSKDFDISMVTDFDNAKDNLIYTLVNYERNKAFLQTVPHKQVEDMAFIYKLLLPETNIYGDMATITIHDNLFRFYDVSVEELHEIAEENMPRLLPGRVRHISDLIEGFDVPWADDIEMYVVSNIKGTLGAASIFEPEVMSALAEKLGDTYYVIPSSTHEVIVVSENMGEPEVLQAMIGEVNESQLLPEEILGDKPYLVDALEHKIILAERKEEYFKEKELQKEKQEKLKEEEKTQNLKGPKL